jgi:hypothetical protein
MQKVGVFKDRAAGRFRTDVEITLYRGQAPDPYKASSEIAEIGWFNTKSNTRVLSTIVRKRLVPALHDAGLID